MLYVRSDPYSGKFVLFYQPFWISSIQPLKTTILLFVSMYSIFFKIPHISDAVQWLYEQVFSVAFYWISGH